MASSLDQGTLAREREHRRDSRNIDPRVETSARIRKHLPESKNIDPRAKTSARNRKHRLESGSITYRIVNVYLYQAQELTTQR
ncbi:hypothetical protein ACW2QC_04385 [Virgibacillus sp. FSP13]